MTSAFPTFLPGSFDFFSLLLLLLLLVIGGSRYVSWRRSPHTDVHTDSCIDAVAEFANNDIDTDRFVDVLAEFPNNDIDTDRFVDVAEESDNDDIHTDRYAQPQENNNNPKFKFSIDDFRSVVCLAAPPAISKLLTNNSSILSKDTQPQTLAPQLRLAEETTCPPQNMTTYINDTKPKVKLMHHVIDEGEGETMSIFRQGCFQYKEAGSVEDIYFEGSPTELAIKLGPGFEEAMLEAIIGMKSNGRRIIYIPREEQEGRRYAAR
ncbi:hypothetical protein ACFE04_026446 [Oxalis oulophora]